MFSLECVKDVKNNKSIISIYDGVGTKSSFVEIIYGSKGYRILGQDIVNHCINDILVQGAKPLFFLDYFASSKFPTNTIIFITRHSYSFKKMCKSFLRKFTEFPAK